MRHDTETTCHCGAAYHGSDHCPECGCEQYETIAVRDCGHNVPMYAVGTKRPYTGVVCHGDRIIGRVTTQRRQRGERYYTATPTLPDGGSVFTASLGTRYPTFMAAARALWLFDRTYSRPNTGPQDVLRAAVKQFRLRLGVVPGQKFECPERLAA